MGDRHGRTAERPSPRTGRLAGTSSWTAIVLAGSRAGPDRLADHFAAAAKALIPVAGEPMLGRVVRTLLACRSHPARCSSSRSSPRAVARRARWPGSRSIRASPSATGGASGIAASVGAGARHRGGALAGAGHHRRPSAAHTARWSTISWTRACRFRRERRRGRAPPAARKISPGPTHMAALRRGRLYRRESVRRPQCARAADARPVRQNGAGPEAPAAMDPGISACRWRCVR